MARRPGITLRSPLTPPTRITATEQIYSEEDLRDAISTALNLKYVRNGLEPGNLMTAAIYAFVQIEELDLERGFIQAAVIDYLRTGALNCQATGDEYTLKQSFPQLATKLAMVRSIIRKFYGMKDRKKILTDLKFIRSILDEAIKEMDID